MRREDFIHVLQAAAAVVQDELVVVGSQAVLGTVDAPPPELLRSMEVGVYPRSKPERAVEIDGAIGEGSRFHETYGYYAHGVGPETITAPVGWESRLQTLELVPIRRAGGQTIVWCLSLPDLMLAKLAAGRPHDITFVEEALNGRLVTVDELRLGVDLMPENSRAGVARGFTSVRSSPARRQTWKSRSLRPSDGQGRK